jgi:hypothetical protein
MYHMLNLNSNKTGIEARSRNHCCGGKTLSITYSDCVSVAIVIQNLKLMRIIILLSVAFPTLQIVFHLSS